MLLEWRYTVYLPVPAEVAQEMSIQIRLELENWQEMGWLIKVIIMKKLSADMLYPYHFSWNTCLIPLSVSSYYINFIIIGRASVVDIQYHLSFINNAVNVYPVYAFR
jgi:hypothetical protein